MKVPPLDLIRQYEPIRKEILGSVEKILSNGHFILGEEVTQLEHELSKFIGVKHTIGVTSGTDALWLALKAVGVKAGDEVLTTPFTFFATVSAIANTGAKPVFADIDPKTFNIDPSKVEELLKTKKVKAIIAVHLYGQMADMGPLQKLSVKYGVPVIEDACQAIGAKYKDSQAGSIGALGCFSFFPTKNLGCLGDGGLVSSNDSTLAEKVRMLRTHGSREKYHHLTIGGNFRLDTLQAAVLLQNLKHLPEWIEKRQEAAEYYDEKLVKLNGAIETPFRAGDRTHTFHQYTIRVVKGDRGALQKHLHQKGIGTAVYYPIPCHLQIAMNDLGVKHQAGDFPHSEKAAKEVLSIPLHPCLLKEEQDYVVSSIEEWTKG